MPKKEKKISITSFDEIKREQCVPTKIEQWNGNEIVITHTLSLVEMLKFVNEVVESCFSADGEYFPEIMDFSIKSNVLTRYANFSLPENIEHSYDLIYNTDAFYIVCEYIDKTQLNEIVESINRKIAYLRDSDILKTQKQIEKIISTFNNLQKQTENMFSGIEPKDIQNLIGALNGGSFNEEKFIDAYLNRVYEKPSDKVDP